MTSSSSAGSFGARRGAPVGAGGRVGPDPGSRGSRRRQDVNQPPCRLHHRQRRSVHHQHVRQRAVDCRPARHERRGRSGQIRTVGGPRWRSARSRRRPPGLRDRQDQTAVGTGQGRTGQTCPRAGAVTQGPLRTHSDDRRVRRGVRGRVGACTPESRAAGVPDRRADAWYRGDLGPNVLARRLFWRCSHCSAVPSSWPSKTV